MKLSKKPIYVTQPFLPPLKEFIPMLEDIWDMKWLTNMGKYHQMFEEKLAEYLGVKYVCLFTNGTLALITALQALRITGEVITTPFSFVATTHALNWNRITPVFADIEVNFCNLDPCKIEKVITPKTTAILPVHVYGNPCQVDKIQKIADTYGLKIIYDACHAFGVKINGTSICNFGDLTALSFHATKVFTTFEGGAIICHDEKMKKRIDFLKNFGFANEITVVAPGINAKMNEFSAALGLFQLKYFNQAIEKRKKVAQVYRKKLKGIKGIKFLENIPNVQHNYAYFPILINEKEFGLSRDQVYDKLKKFNIFTRRYFYPLISQFPIYRDLLSANPSNLQIAEKITKEILCLPIFTDLSFQNCIYIVEKIRKLTC